MAEQNEWRFCTKCNSLFYNGYDAKGACAAGGSHTAMGYDFMLPYDLAPTAYAQDGWRFCTGCQAMFYDGSPDQAPCPAGGNHAAAGFNFVLPHDVPGTPTAQTEWRFCGGCHAMFYDGYDDKGRCPRGGAHAALGYGFVLPHRPDGEVPAPVVALRYTGMICFGEVDVELDGEDEIYILTTAITSENGNPVVRTERHPIGVGTYEHVNQGGSWDGPVAACYQGPAQDVSIVVTVMEHDEGDPDKYRETVESVARAGSIALLGAGIPVPDWAEKLAVDLVNGLLDLGDDNLGVVSKSFRRSELLAEADKPRLEEQGVKYTWFTMHNGEGSTYKAYFDVVPA